MHADSYVPRFRLKCLDRRRGRSPTRQPLSLSVRTAVHRFIKLQGEILCCKLESMLNETQCFSDRHFNQFADKRDGIAVEPLVAMRERICGYQPHGAFDGSRTRDRQIHSLML